jgi:hypothetical protein
VGHDAATEVDSNSDTRSVENASSPEDVLFICVNVLMQIDNSMVAAPFIARPRRRRFDISGVPVKQV